MNQHLSAQARQIAQALAAAQICGWQELASHLADYDRYVQSGGAESFEKLLVHRRLVTAQQLQSLRQSHAQATAQTPLPPGPVTKPTATPLDMSPIPATRVDSASQSRGSGSRGSSMGGPQALVQSTRLSEGATDIPGFVIEKKLGEGGMGVVYQALDTQQRRVALKLMRARASTSKALKRFARERDVLEKLVHPNIVQIFDSGSSPLGDWISMELIDGQPLDEYLEKNKPSPTQALEWMIQIARGLRQVHELHIIHRDLKPSNIMICSPTSVKIMDFGLAKDMTRDTVLTQENSILGTPHYLSPEQSQGQTSKVGPHSDVFSLGVIFFEMLVGHRPFDADTPHQLYVKIATEEVDSPNSRDDDVPRIFSDICMKALNKAPEDRYQDMDHFLDDAERALEGERFEVERRMDRLKRFAGRHPALVAGLSLLLLLLLASPWLVSLVQQSRRFKAEKQQAKSLVESLQLSSKDLKKALEKRDASIESSLSDCLKTIDEVQSFADEALPEIKDQLSVLLKHPKLQESLIKGRVLRARRRLQQRNYNGAETDCATLKDELKTDSAELYEAQEILAEVAFLKGQPEVALRRLKELNHKAPSSRRWSLQAQVHEAIGEPTAALEVVDKALALSKDSLELRCQRAQLLATAGKKRQAQKAFAALIRKHPRSFLVYQAQARAFRQLKLKFQATEAYRKALSQGGKRVALVQEVSEYFRELSWPGEAEAILKTALAERDSVAIRLEYLSLSLEQGWLKRAKVLLTELEKPRKTASQSIEYTKHCVLYRVLLNEWDKARSLVRDWLKQSPNDFEGLRLQLLLSRGQKNQAKALKAFEALAKDQASARMILAQACYDCEFGDRALAYCEAELKKNKSHSYALLIKAKVLERQGKSKEAQALLRKQARVRRQELCEGQEGTSLAARLGVFPSNRVKPQIMALLRRQYLFQPMDCETLWRLGFWQHEGEDKAIDAWAKKTLSSNPYCLDALLMIISWRPKKLKFKEQDRLKFMSLLQSMHLSEAEQERLWMQRAITEIRLRRFNQALRAIRELEALKHTRQFELRIALAQAQGQTQLAKRERANFAIQKQEIRRLQIEVSKLFARRQGLGEVFHSKYVKQAKALLKKVDAMNPNGSLQTQLWSDAYLLESNGFVSFIIEIPVKYHDPYKIIGFYKLTADNKVFLDKETTNKRVDEKCEQYDLSPAVNAFTKAIYHITETFPKFADRKTLKQEAIAALTQAERCLQHDRYAQGAYALKAHAYKLLGLEAQAEFELRHFTDKTRLIWRAFLNLAKAVQETRFDDAVKACQDLLDRGYPSRGLPTLPQTRPLQKNPKFRALLNH